MTKKIIIANWKMNSSFDEAQIWVENFYKKLLEKKSKNLPEIVLCPPSVMIDHIDSFLIENEFEEIEKLQQKIEQIEEKTLEKLITKLRVIKLGGQDCSNHNQGAFTGEISAKMLQDCGAWYVILGHSERRNYHAETSQTIAQKIIAAVKQNLTPILCIGESKDQRENNNYQNFITEQLEQSLPENLTIKKLIIAYEPVWSIGTGTTPTIIEIEKISALIKTQLQKNKNISEFKIVYGGSVNEKNAQNIIDAKNIDGLLIGGSSLDFQEFYNITQMC